MSNSITIDLEHPLTVTLGKGLDAREEIIDTIELRRPKVKDIKGVNLQKIEGDELILLVTRLSSLDRTTVSEIDLADFLKLAEAIGSFFPTPLEDEIKAK